MAVSEELKSTVGRALGRIPSGLFIVSTVHEGLECAQLASWVQQAGFEPPVLSVSLGNERQAGSLIRARGMFAISILGDADHALMKKYARGVEPGPEAFSGVEILHTPEGLPMLRDALAWLECRLLQTCEFASDHVLLMGRVLAGQLLKDGRPFVHVRGNGFHY
jgi:flavin reductase (DIM6/NTAB) family NADH-FMN oxidoreductase RutF